VYKSRILPAISLSILLTWIFKDFLTPLILLGKDFETRSLFIKIILLFLYFVLFSIVIVIFFPKKFEQYLEKYHYVLIPIYCAPLILNINLGLYSRFYADDYCSAAIAKSLGVFPSVNYWYMNWSGRFSAHLFDAIMGYFGPQISPYSTLLIISIWICILTAVLIYLKNSTQRNFQNIIESLFLTLIIVYTTLEVTPEIAGSLYWGQGMRSVIPPLILGTSLIGIYKYLLLRKNQSFYERLIWFFALGLVIIFAGGFAETYSALQVFLFSIFLLYFLLFLNHSKNQALPFITIGLVFALISMAIVILAPGNKARQEFFPPPPNLIRLIDISLVSMIKYLDGLFANPIKLLALIGVFLSSIGLGTGLIFSPLEFNNILFIKTHLKNIFLAFMNLLAMIFVCFLPSAYGTSSSLPSRTMIIPTYIIVCSLVFIGYKFGQIIGYLLIQNHKNSISSVVIKVFINLLLIVFSINAIESTIKNIQLINPYRVSAEQWDFVNQMIIKGKENGEEIFSIPIIHHPARFQSVGSVDWINDCAKDYYNVKKIVGEGSF
jgi:hypothetical protein